MTSAALTHDILLPRSPGGHGWGALLSLAAHGLLLFALVTAVQWRTHSPDIVSAELWASVPETAAPSPAAPPAPPPEPTPTPAPQPAPPPPAAVSAEPPPKVDIATERAERAEKARRERLAAETEAARRKKDQARAEAEKKRLEREQLERDRRLKREQAEAAAAEARLEQQRQDNLKRMMGQAGATAPSVTAASAPGLAGTGTRNAAPSASYAGRLVAVIRSNLVFTGDVPGNPVAEVRVRATATGAILSREFVKRSGHAAWDDAVLRAIDKTGTLPRDTDGRVPPEIIISFRPKE